MADKAEDPLSLKAADPTVRLRGKKQEYGETEEIAIFESRGGKPEDLMDEERWLQDPTGGQATWSSLNTLHQLHRSRDQKPAFGEEGSENLCIWDPSTVEDMENEGLPSAIDHCQTFRKGFRMPIGEIWAFKVLARACQATTCKPYHLSTDQALRKLLGIAQDNLLTPSDKIKAVVVGLSTITFEPVVLVKADTTQVAQDADGLRDDQSGNKGPGDRINKDNMELVTLKTLPDNLLCGNGINWFQNALIPGNLAYVKRALWDQLSTHEKRTFLQIMKREHTLLMKGLGSSAVTTVLPSNEDQERKPAICRPIHSTNDWDNLHYILEWPPMALLNFSHDIISAVRSFPRKCKHDSVPVNLALAAIIIFFDLEKKEQKDEGFLWTKIPEVPLARFVLYFPHMLRFVEVMQLTAFVNPLRFAEVNYRRDCHRNLGEFQIDPEGLDTAKMRQWYTALQSHSPTFSSSYRFKLVPASMPGTSMVFPQACPEVDQPSPDLFALCLLDDVRTFGLPSYHPDAREECYQMVGGPTYLFPACELLSSLRLHGSQKAGYWKPELKQRIMALTGPAREVGHIFGRVVAGSISNLAQSRVLRLFDEVCSYREDLGLRDSVAEIKRREVCQETEQLLHIAKSLGVSELWMDIDTLRLGWHGMEAHLSAVGYKKGQKRVAVPDFPRSNKRIKAPIRLLNPRIKSKIEELIENLEPLSLDWDPLRDYLKSTPQPTANGAQDALLHVKSFISDMQNAFSEENSENCQGSLDRVIRMAFRAAGFYDEPQLALVNYETRWVVPRKKFSEFGKLAGDTMEAIYRLRGTADEFSLASPQIEKLRESKMVKDQNEDYKKIDSLLENNLSSV
ncbi:hypothetical protein FSARC_6578 [Fusarium sarcochroum]|uniref:Uncharacterized protein n=1 Tax=Fusarium sarcochroum TaxID=1208366 RepID=A0A8H4X976_9HYPO|nr:hypothetical protein FSARC_6578 [Fusarium sarcochroum]